MLVKFQIFLICIGVAFQLTILPYPQNVSLGNKSFTLTKPCETKIGFQNINISEAVLNITQFYLQLTFPSQKCIFAFPSQDLFSHQQNNTMVVNVSIDNTDQGYKLDAAQERYQLTISEDGLVNLKTSTYVGYLRALDTLSQLIEKNDDGTAFISNLPLIIQDEPAFEYRGVMIDTARHYLSIQTIERTIDAMMLNKLNVLHWHITDDDSFPLLLKSLRVLADYGAYSSKLVYTSDDVKHIIQYAKAKGVQIVPELDSPAHARSWGNSEQLSQNTLTCGDAWGSPPQYGQFDPTLESTYQVLESVMTELSELFDDINVPFVHFGGDEVLKSCWDSRPSIKEFMVKMNITDYDALQVYYRVRQNKIWTNQIKSKKAIAYWASKESNLPVEPNDIIQWWGTTEDLSSIKDKQNKIVLSNYDLLYLDTGMGNLYGNPYSVFSTWKNIYLKFDPRPQEIINGTVIGGEVCLWGETNSDSSHFVKLFSRASVLADRLWNPEHKDNEKLSDFVKRMVQIEVRMVELGFPVMPSTSQYCGLHTEVCFP